MTTSTTSTGHTIEITYPSGDTLARVITTDGRTIAGGRWSSHLQDSEIGLDRVHNWLTDGAHCGGPSVCGWASICDPATCTDCYEPEPLALTEAALSWRGYAD